MDEQVLSVTQLLNITNGLLEPHYFSVVGEITSLSPYAYGIFFTVKDEEGDALLSCYLPRAQFGQPLEIGMRIQMAGRLKIYVKNGKLSLNVERYQLAGAGSLERAFKLLVEKLTLEGIIDPKRKRPLPTIPQRIGLISSQDAAGFGDFMKIIQERVPGLKIYFTHVPVQGIRAPEAIIKALAYLNQEYLLDCIVLVRGGGSVDELQTFNHEGLARAIASSKAPVLTGIGHERDVSIADMVADVRAATPSAAAQILLPLTSEVTAQLDHAVQVTASGVQALIKRYHLQIQAILHFSSSQTRAIMVSLGRRLDQLLALSQMATTGQLQLFNQRVAEILRRIELLSPKRTLERGYTLTLNASGQALSSCTGLLKGGQLYTQFADGKIESSITNICDHD